MSRAMSSQTFHVVHNTPEKRFEVRVDGWLCRLDYELQGHALHLVHTQVPAAVEGRGIAAALAHAALSWARETGFKVSPRCSYIQSYLKRHPQWQDLLV